MDGAADDVTEVERVLGQWEAEAAVKAPELADLEARAADEVATQHDPIAADLGVAEPDAPASSFRFELKGGAFDIDAHPDTAAAGRAAGLEPPWKQVS